MAKYVVGIDPDAKAHGVAVYIDGRLGVLKSMPLMEFIEYVLLLPPGQVRVHIEDVNGISAAFRARDGGGNIHVKLKKAQSIGMCKQAQLELERFLSAHDIEFHHHRVSKKWKKEKATFEKITGWTSRSNEDTRSAAYFGYLGVRMF